MQTRLQTTRDDGNQSLRAISIRNRKKKEKKID